MTRTALPETCASTAQLWLRLGHAVYLGPSLGLAAHSTAIASLGVGVDAPFRVRVPGARDITARSFLFRARITHHVVHSEGRMLFCFFDPTSSRVARTLGSMTGAVGDYPVGHRNEAELVELSSDPDIDVERLLDAASMPLPHIRDPRIAATAAAIRADPTAPQRAAERAAAAGLSTSYFLRTFTEQTGTSFRRYVQWARMLRVAEAYAAGHDLTRAAVDAGFASPSHFSDTFRSMFGLTPTAFTAVGSAVQILDS
ncbi:helix-turn-helix domain-containing protein [Nocardia donostiensis]|uniref:AraC family transcriptional regulator n=1 Tax=Nocardia donostiensis TaxID=1538463 RepID=A0A1W0B3T5_9NOCA|nr:helix-turn-helix domain-containing protein [Nocardia donostiensis]ONM50598.1 AraC family transcriptional regulator [Nocardia donostiensis]OQS17169.1 AraC family transcriptional regulator [Nocardia donostiensis]OQS20758.1 AraC family transcriptional regulator [Nocardia donostiensis]